MADTQHTGDRHEKESSARRRPSQDGLEGQSSETDHHPLGHLQRQIGNARIARSLGTEDSMLWSQAEVGAAGGPISNRLASRIYESLGSGKPLSQGTKSKWEGAYGVPLDSVRVHDDSEANELSLSVSASAFTLGSDVFLSHDADPADDRLMGHEIAHVIQQQAATTGGPLVVGAAHDDLEQEADLAARTAPMAEESNRQATLATPVVQRGFLDEMNLGNISGILGTGGSIVGGLAEAANLPLANAMGISAPQITSVPGLGALGGLTSAAGLYTGGRDMLDESKPWYERGVGGMSAVSGATGLASTISSMFGSSLFAAGGSAGLTAGAGSALTGGGAGLATGAGAATALGSLGAVLGAGAAGYGAGRLLDEGVGSLGQALTGDEQGDYTISGGMASGMTAIDQSLTSLWADPDRPAYTQTIGWQLGELLGI